MKEIYGIFYFENYDENTLYNAYVTKELAERELQVLKAKNSYIGCKGKIEKISLYENETELTEIPETFIVHGNVKMKNNGLEIELFDYRIHYEINFLLFNYEKQLYGFSVLISKDYFNNPRDIVEQVIRANFYDFQKQFMKLLSLTNVRFMPRLNETSSLLHTNTELKINLFEQSSQYKDYIENCRNDALYAYDKLCKNFARSFQIGFKDFFDRYLNKAITDYFLDEIKYDFIADISRENWFNKNDPLDLNNCFMTYVRYQTMFP